MMRDRTESELPTAIVVDDHKGVREALCMFFSTKKICNVVGQGTTVCDGRRLCEELTPDLAIVDLVLRGESGVVLLRHIHDEWPMIHSLVYTGCVKEATLAEALDCQPNGFVFKASDLNTLPKAVHRICVEKVPYFCPLTAKIRAKLRTGKDKIIPQLSPREKEILVLVAEGGSSRSIARCLKLSQRTVDGCRGRLMQKLCANDIASLIRTGISLGIIPEHRRLKIDAEEET